MVDKADFQAFLDGISDCFITHDFEPWRSRIILPFSLVTSVGPIVLTTEEALRENFELYLQAVDAMKLDQVVRVPISFEDCVDGTWIGTYETNLLSGGVRATDPYISSALLIPYPDGLKMTSILNARGHHYWTGLSP
ncbi:hypothetical protein [Aestuariivita sp.]|jgi:hypothetical protein|uniref:hypothetical protein n=1 Tax=Aestuariivita sp. TaxID=1872407 RepID=UPI00217312FF|nr:hypothetical protein [Aestuariivita sp.]MCE8007494.1 hypothetical protein [Aestuariivita sp.]